MKKKILYIILFILIIILVSVIIVKKYYKISNNDTVTNTSDSEANKIVTVEEENVDIEEKYKDYVDITTDKIKETRVFNNLEFSNGILKIKDNSAVYQVTIKNSTDKDIKLGNFYIVFKDKDSNTIDNLTGYVEEIKAGGEITPYISAEINLKNAYNLEYREIENKK